MSDQEKRNINNDDSQQVPEDLEIFDIEDGKITEEFPIDEREGGASAAAVKPVVPHAQQSSDDKKKRAGGAHAKKAQSAYIQKSSRMRKILIVVVILLILLLLGIGFYAYNLYTTAQDTATQQTQTTVAESLESDGNEKDAMSTASKKTTVPNLVELLGHNQEEAIQMLAHGAQVVRVVEINEEGNPIKSDVQIALTEEPSDSRTGTPTVYISLNEAGVIIRSGYSVATSSLGYGSLSFSDAVEVENIVEKTLEEAGLTVGYGTVALPADKMEYSTYGTDGTTLEKEYCTFNGVGIANDVEHAWEAMLSYDYTMANATDNLSDTIRTIYIYIS